MVIAWILNSVSKDISTSLIYAPTAREMWLDLRDRFQQRNGPKIFHLRRELMTLQQNHASVSVYFTKLKTLGEELNNYRPTSTCSCGGIKDLNEYHHMEYVMSFFMGLDESFSGKRSNLTHGSHASD